MPPSVMVVPSGCIESKDILPTLVIFPSDTSNDPQAILEAPLSIFPKPEVIDPEFRAPTVTKSVSPT